MMHSYSIGQLASLMRKTERTVLRYIQAGKLPVIKAGNSYMVDEDVLQAFMPGQLTAPVASSVDTRLDALENRVAAIEARIASQGVAVAQIRSSDESLPDGAVALHTFAAMHGVNRRTLLDHVQRGNVEASERPKSGRANEMERYFLPGQQARIIAFWSERGTKYTPCERCPHEGK